MTRRLLLLNGLAVLAVAVHHASGYGFFAMFDWTDRYLPVTVPNYDQVGSLAFFAIVLIQQLDNYALPAFMFVSGFFLAFAARSGEQNLSWDVVRARVKNLIIPFTIWTVIFFVFFQRRLPANLDELFDRYYYVILLCQYYVISPFIVPFARDRWKLLLIVAPILEFSRFWMRYLPVVGVDYPGQGLLITLTPKWLPPTLFFWFCLGMVAGFHRVKFAEWLEKARWWILVSLVSFAALAFIEYRMISSATGVGWLGPYFGGVARIFYSLSFILCFLAFDKITLPFSKQLSNLGSKSLGIYLVHGRTMYIAAVAMYQFFPLVLGNQLVYQLTLIAAGIGGSLLLMEIVKRSPARKYYRYLFG